MVSCERRLRAHHLLASHANNRLVAFRTSAVAVSSAPRSCPPLSCRHPRRTHRIAVRSRGDPATETEHTHVALTPSASAQERARCRRGDHRALLRGASSDGAAALTAPRRVCSTTTCHMLPHTCLLHRPRRPSLLSALCFLLERPQKASRAHKRKTRSSRAMLVTSAPLHLRSSTACLHLHLLFTTRRTTAHDVARALLVWGPAGRLTSPPLPHLRVPSSSSLDERPRDRSRLWVCGAGVSDALRVCFVLFVCLFGFAVDTPGSRPLFSP